MNRNDLTSLLVRNPKLIEKCKSTRDTYENMLNNDSTLTIENQLKLQQAIIMLDRLIWAYEATDKPDLVQNLYHIFHEAKKMANEEKITNKEIENYCISRTQDEIIPLLITEAPKLYPNADIDKMVSMMHQLIATTFSDIDYHTLNEREMITAVLESIYNN